MGEYAKRISDGQKIKIGTCEMMYYSRWSQRKDFVYGYPMNNCCWRLPLPSEDGIQVGDYDSHRSWADDCDTLLKPDANMELSPSGIVQAKTDSGILVNIKCPHGGDLPELPEDSPVKLFYNGMLSRNILVRVSGVVNAEDEMRIDFTCKACGSSWWCGWEEAKQYMQENELTKRLFFMCVEYWWELHKTVPDYSISWEKNDGTMMFCMPQKCGDWYNYGILVMKEDGTYGELIQGDAEYVSKFIYRK